MKKSLKMKAFIVLVMLVMTITISTISNAADVNYSVGMSLTSSSKLKEGDTVTIKVNLTSIDAANGIDVIVAKLDYDTNVFEEISKTNFTENNDWDITYEASTKKMVITKDEKVKTPETVITINLKVRDVINVNSTTITLKEIVVSGGLLEDNESGDVTVNDAPVTLTKEKAPAVTPTTPSTNNTVKDNTTTTTPTLPKTGIAQYSAITIVVVAIIAIVSYIAYKKIAKDVK